MRRLFTRSEYNLFRAYYDFDSRIRRVAIFFSVPVTFVFDKTKTRNRPVP